MALKLKSDLKTKTQKYDLDARHSTRMNIALNIAKKSATI
jgi:hypothetical protein